jgi:UDP-N-acetylmuramoylalanine--D-glutamate ligase
MGLGRHGGGLGAAKYLARRGAILTISEQAAQDDLAEPLAELADVPIHAIHCGGHDERDFTDAQCVVVNPAVRPDHPCLQLARARRAQLTSEIELVLDDLHGRAPAHTIGVTGSNGKSTTATLLRDILAAAGRRVWLGGNIGGSLLGELDRIGGDDWVVVELSSFQLAHLSRRARLPKIAVVTTCAPNHLDWHGSFEAYVAAKRRLVSAPETQAVLGAHDPVTRDWLRLRGGATRPGWPLDEIGPLALAGLHNRQNAALAAAAAEAAGVERPLIRQALAAFRGLEHRLQLVGRLAGRRFYDDSKATSPEATIAALAAIGGPLWLLAGGVSKGASFAELAGNLVRCARGAALFGAARGELAASLDAMSTGFNHAACETLAEALLWCWRRSRAGDAILLSPACASHDQFRDFQARGLAFREFVRDLKVPGEQPRHERLRRLASRGALR